MKISITEDFFITTIINLVKKPWNIYCLIKYKTPTSGLETLYHVFPPLIGLKSFHIYSTYYTYLLDLPKIQVSVWV